MKEPWVLVIRFDSGKQLSKFVYLVLTKPIFEKIKMGFYQTTVKDFNDRGYHA